MSVRDKNPTDFYGTGNREKRIGKSFKSFIYFFICRNLCADCYRSIFIFIVIRTFARFFIHF